MLMVTRYTMKPFMSKEEVGELMNLFGELGDNPDQIAHYANADGGGGTLVVETDDPTAEYQRTLRYAPYMQFETQIVQKIEDAVPDLLAVVAD